MALSRGTGWQCSALPLGVAVSLRKFPPEQGLLGGRREKWQFSVEMGGFCGILIGGLNGLGSYYVLGQDRVAEASQITPGVLEKAFLAVGHGLGFSWGSIWSEGLGEDRETMKMSIIEEIILGT